MITRFARHPLHSTGVEGGSNGSFCSSVADAAAVANSGVAISAGGGSRGRNKVLDYVCHFGEVERVDVCDLINNSDMRGLRKKVDANKIERRKSANEGRLCCSNEANNFLRKRTSISIINAWKILYIAIIYCITTQSVVAQETTGEFNRNKHDHYSI